MSDYEEEPLPHKLQTTLSWLGAILIESLFLAGWVILQWGLDQIIQLFPLPPADRWLLPIFQVFFAISTLVLVGSYILEDIINRIIAISKKINRK